MQAVLSHFLYFPMPIFFLKYKCKEPTGFFPPRSRPPYNSDGLDASPDVFLSLSPSCPVKSSVFFLS